MNAVSLIEQAKSRAAPVHSCVRARVQPGHLVGTDTGVEELLALIIVLAEVADSRRLAELVKLPGDEGLAVGRDALLQAAHAQVWHLRKNKQPVPLRLGLLENEYQADRKQRRSGEPEEKAA
jgi:hypothetical protein